MFVMRDLPFRIVREDVDEEFHDCPGVTRRVERAAELKAQLKALFETISKAGENVELLSAVNTECSPFVEDDIVLLPAGGSNFRVLLLRTHGNGILNLIKAKQVEIESVHFAPQEAIEGGDIIQVGSTVFARSPSGRMTVAGFSFLQSHTEELGLSLVPVEVKEGVKHLTTGASYAGVLSGKPTVLLNPLWVSSEDFKNAGIRTLSVPDDPRERWAANVLPVKHGIIVQEGCAGVEEILRNAGAKNLLRVPWHEFTVPDENGNSPCGHFTCCTLRVPEVLA